MTTKAKRADIPLGDRIIEGFMLPDGTYRMSVTQAATCVGLTQQNATDFLRSKAIKRLLGEDYTPRKNEQIEIESVGQNRGSSRINPLSLDEVSAYWLWQTYRANKQALALCMALITESLERRFDAAFSVERSESDRNNRLQNRLDSALRDLQQIGEGLAFDDDLRRENALLLDVLKQNGIDPYGLPEK